MVLFDVVFIGDDTNVVFVVVNEVSGGGRARGSAVVTTVGSVTAATGSCNSTCFLLLCFCCLV